MFTINSVLASRDKICFQSRGMCPLSDIGCSTIAHLDQELFILLKGKLVCSLSSREWEWEWAVEPATEQNWFGVAWNKSCWTLQCVLFDGFLGSRRINTICIGQTHSKQGNEKSRFMSKGKSKNHCVRINLKPSAFFADTDAGGSIEWKWLVWQSGNTLHTNRFLPWWITWTQTHQDSIFHLFRRRASVATSIGNNASPAAHPKSSGMCEMSSCITSTPKSGIVDHASFWIDERLVWSWRIHSRESHSRCTPTGGKNRSWFFNCVFISSKASTNIIITKHILFPHVEGNHMCLRKLS